MRFSARQTRVPMSRAKRPAPANRFRSKITTQTRLGRNQGKAHDPRSNTPFGASGTQRERSKRTSPLAQYVRQIAYWRGCAVVVAAGLRGWWWCRLRGGGGRGTKRAFEGTANSPIYGPSGRKVRKGRVALHARLFAHVPALAGGMTRPAGQFGAWRRPRPLLAPPPDNDHDHLTARNPAPRFTPGLCPPSIGETLARKECRGDRILITVRRPGLCCGS